MQNTFESSVLDYIRMQRDSFNRLEPRVDYVVRGMEVEGDEPLDGAAKASRLRPGLTGIRSAAEPYCC
jgi:hypothetical protein